MALVYDYHTADNADPPHVKVFSTYEDDESEVTQVANFYINPDAPGGLTLELAQKLGEELCIRHNSGAR